MAIAILLMTGAVAPVTASIHRPAKHISHYKRRTIQKGRQGGELRILACFQNFRNVSGMISLIDSSNATTESPLTTLNDSVSIQSLTAMSPQASMHEDICSLAEEKHPALLVIPGFGVSENGESSLTMRQILVLFVGGPDDREALACAWRMGGTEGIGLTVVRFLPGDQVEEIEPVDLPVGEAQKMIASDSFVDRNRKLDDEYVNEFRLKTAGEQSVSYQEKVVNNDEEMVLALQEMHHIYDLYVVGRGEGIVSPLTASLADWCEYPELGPVGDLLITSSFAQGSVLVVQQYAAGSKDGTSIADMRMEAVISRTGSTHHWRMVVWKWSHLHKIKEKKMWSRGLINQ
ncbi:hypothetical protein OIU84_024506 [Salix udensis]|uniref:Cation/H(+) antiporter C-terminal domain-containing protein n=1 Tax=Salix udensis TaxID=889485 RepID=A0AAD6PBM0_9ROSI|nr:hypothetical protein OIU84_024506 [Salix udensis]